MAILYTIHSIISISLFPYTYRSTDMLAAIHTAIENFFNGISPYRQMYPYIGAMPYFPLTWISFIPSYLIGMDFRLFAAFMTVISFYLIYRNYDRLPLLNQYLVILMFMNPHISSQNDLYFQCFTLMLIAVTIYLVDISYKKQVLLISVFALTYQFAWVLLPFYILQISKSFKLLIINTCIVFTVFALTVYFTCNHDIQQFYNSAFELHLPNLYTHGDSDITFSIGNLLVEHKLWLLTIQMTSIIILSAFSLAKWIKYRCTYNFMSIAVFAYFVYMSTSFYIMQYMYFPVLIVIALTGIKSEGSIKLQGKELSQTIRLSHSG